MKEEAGHLHEGIDVLHLKHKQYADEIQTCFNNHSVDQSEIKRLAGIHFPTPSLMDMQGLCSPSHTGGKFSFLMKLPISVCMNVLFALCVFLQMKMFMIGF